MIEQERFKLVSGIKLGTHSGIWDSRKQHNQGIGDELWLGEVVDLLNKLHKENEQLKHELLCKQLDKAPTEPINCKCYYKELKE